MDTNALKRFAQEARIVLKNKVSSKIDLVLNEKSSARRENSKAVRDLESKIRATNKDKVVEQVAYTWFNRFTALQYMDVNGYNRVRVIAPADNQTRPEIMSDASAGVFDDNLVSENTKNIVTSLLDGRSASIDPDNEAYRYLIVSACNYWHSAMPFLFEKIADYTELLMPDDLLSGNSILVKLRDAMTPENCEDVEVIGWLYQFYISEKKDEVFAGLKKNQKVTPENIPAATQLFTPNWIVKYLVENSLGRLWMLNRPNSSLIDQMEYYIAPEEPETDFLKITSPEEIKICDPACGSGHMLTYSFDLLYSIYEEEGYDATSIPTLILQNNLYGIELDQRAGELSAFALTMKARGKHRRFLHNPVQPNICVLENVKFQPQELDEYMTAVGRDLFTHPLRITLAQFVEADNFGSLIQPALQDVEGTLEVLQSKDLSGNLFLKATQGQVLKVLSQADYLRQKYHVVVANPPYMGSKGMNEKLSDYAKKEYPDSKSDLFAMFMERTLRMTVKRGVMAMINMQSWMFLSSYEKLRGKLLSNATLITMAHMGPRGFDTIGGEVVSTTAFAFQNQIDQNYSAKFLRLITGKNESEKSRMTRHTINGSMKEIEFKSNAKDLLKLPGSPIAYWLSNSFRTVFDGNQTVEKLAEKVTKGIFTGDNNQFLRFWYEINQSNKGWKKYDKAGESRRWFGSAMHVLDWRNNGFTLSRFRGAGLGSMKYYDKPHFVWSGLSTGTPSYRYSENHVWFDDVSPSVIGSKESEALLSYLNCNIATKILMTLNPTLHYQIGDVKRIPVPVLRSEHSNRSRNCVKIAKSDWDAYETSWDFTTHPIFSSDYRSSTLQNTYSSLRIHWQGMTDEMLRLEEENNQIFIDAYGLQDELTPDVPLHEITLTCNPAYRYGKKVSKEVQEQRLREDTVKEFISYAVGCMFGRYALEEPGLVLANQGETLEDYLQKIPNPSFSADDDNVIPILDGDWFDDDVTERFRKFLRITFGEDNFTENLRFIESALGKDIRKYFLKDFYKDHVQKYKKRPIYWQFSSPRGSFNALIYMHRYNRDTVSVMLDQYLREFKVKLTSQKSSLERIEISADATQGEKSKAMNEIQKINSTLEELDTWERDVVFPLATQRIEIDLDDGVKTNYPKFGNALSKVIGLS
ncbi:BREX-1 system adenine-specific DNA-methyltransferase PglX [Paracoccaceae bacterium]|nr:BREX-1 system adenine-specific DNA-methyltransferase PglX [Paracoccaceae bacterium]